MYNIFWFRRDLRFEDNHGLYKILEAKRGVLAIFIFDRHILDKLEADDRRVPFIFREIMKIKAKLKEYGSDLLVFYDTPEKVFKTLIASMGISAVYTNEDYEPYALKRDATIKSILAEQRIDFFQFKDHVIFHKNEVVKKDGSPYTVFTPYKRTWLNTLKSFDYKPFDSMPSIVSWQKFIASKNIPSSLKKEITLQEMGFQQSNVNYPSSTVPKSKIHNYHLNRDVPSLEGTSMLGVHFRFGTISIREKARKALKLNETFLSELIWRDFYSMILYHFPHVVNGPFREKYRAIEWRNNEAEFERWKTGETGIPIVDAGMRQLNSTGYMHNRVRMISASFLTKNLLIDWRWGEAYFAKLLLDFDLASNNGGWQWAAGTGTDAAPYFRVFNPVTQQKKFDKDLMYCKHWVPELETIDYVAPMVDLSESRKRCLEVYKKALQSGG